MQHIYCKDADGRKIVVEVTDEVAQAYHESRRKEWRGNAKERYHTVSLEAATDAGHEFEDESASIDVLTREEDGAAGAFEKVEGGSSASYAVTAVNAA